MFLKNPVLLLHYTDNAWKDALLFVYNFVIINSKKCKTNMNLCVVRSYRTSAFRVAKHGVIRQMRYEKPGKGDVT